MSEEFAARVKLAPILTTVILTVLLLWMVGKTADVFLLLFIAVIFSLYLGAVRDFLVHRARVPERLAFFLAIIGTVVALGGLMTLLVPPVVEQTRQLVDVLPAYITNWEKGIDHFVGRFPAMRSVWQPG
ncbi:MAG TPA: AI-2E family transporter, partial [Chthoniobacterales bacterium]